MIQRNEHWLAHKAKVKELLATEEYKVLMKERSTKHLNKKKAALCEVLITSRTAPLLWAVRGSNSRHIYIANPLKTIVRKRNCLGFSIIIGNPFRKTAPAVF